MIATHVKQHTFKGPKPHGSVDNGGRRYASLSGLFKSDSSTSLQDLSISATKPTQKRPTKKIGNKTLVPLLGHDGSMAALVPEQPSTERVHSHSIAEHGNSHSITERDYNQSHTDHAPNKSTTDRGYSLSRTENSHSISAPDVSQSRLSRTERGSIAVARNPDMKAPVTHSLRFPLLSPTRQETSLFFQMRALKNAERFTGKKYTSSFEELLTRNDSPAKSIYSNSRAPTRGRASVELSKVPPSRERQGELLKQGYRSLPVTDRTRRRDKVIVSSKYGYHSRSNSATYKRLNRARTTMDERIESQIIEFVAKSQLPDIASDADDIEVTNDQKRHSDARRKIKERAQLYFNLDPGIYDYFKESKDLNCLYKKKIKSGKFNGSKHSSAKSLKIVLPKVDIDSVAASALPTERSEHDKLTTPSQQHTQQIGDVTKQHLNNNQSDETKLHLSDRSDTVEGQLMMKVPLSLDSLTNPEFTNSNDKNGQFLPNIRRSVTFDNTCPSSPKKRSRRGKKASRVNSTDLDTSVPEMAFLVGDSKSLTPSPNKSRRSQRMTSTSGTDVFRKSTSMSNNHDISRISSRQDSKLAENIENIEYASPAKAKSRISSRLSEQIKSYEGNFEQKESSEMKVTQERHDVISPLILHDSDDEFYDEFENI